MAEEVRKLPYPEDGQGRVETGSIQFGDDWPSYHMRGDDAFALALHIGVLMDYLEKRPPDPDFRGIMLQVAVDELKSLAKQIHGNVVVGGEGLPKLVPDKPVDMEL